jgi:hypothetical protein
MSEVGQEDVYSIDRERQQNDEESTSTQERIQDAEALIVQQAEEAKIKKSRFRKKITLAFYLLELLLNLIAIMMLLKIHRRSKYTQREKTSVYLTVKWIDLYYFTFLTGRNAFCFFYFQNLLRTGALEMFDRKKQVKLILLTIDLVFISAILFYSKMFLTPKEIEMNRAKLELYYIDLLFLIFMTTICAWLCECLEAIVKKWKK